MHFIRPTARQILRPLAMLLFSLSFGFGLLAPRGVQAQAPDPAAGEPVERQVGASKIQETGETQTGCSAVFVNPQDVAAEQVMIELVNQTRAEYGLPPLKRSPELDLSARAHSKDVHDDRYFYHDTYDRVNGALTRVCAWNTRINLYYSGTPEGENVAGGYDPPEKAMQAWMGSAGHRVNILNKNFREIGIGYFYGPNAYNSYWTQDFGTRPDVYPVVINGEAARTTSQQVSLYIYRENDSWDEMRLRNDDGAWSNWQPFSAEMTWTLASTPGEHTVAVQVRRDQSVREVSDTILLDASTSSLSGGAALSQAALAFPTRLAAAPVTGVVASAGSQEPPPEAPPPDVGEAVTEAPDPSAPPDVQPLFTGCTRVNVAVQNASYEQQVIDRVNLERANAGLPPLKRYVELDYAARFHARDMNDDNYFAHDSYDRSGGDLVFACGWSTRVSNYYSGGYKGENAAAGFVTPQAVMDGWMSSSGHRANILSSNYREIGVGYYYGTAGQYGYYWMQDFGSRSGVYPVVINREAASTDVPQVSLYIYRENSNWNEMRIRNDGGTWTAWQSFSSNVNWTLDWVKGARTVEVEVRSGSTVRAVSDTIELTTSGYRLGNLPDSIVFVYDKAAGQHHPASVTLTPRNTGSSAALTWSASENAGWLSLSQSSGTTPSSSFTLTPNAGSLSVGQYTATLTVTVTSPTSPPTEGSPKQISVTLSVVDALDNQVFLPVIMK